MHHTAELGTWSDAGMGHQMIGACAVLVVYGLWTARAHLAEVGRRFLRPGKDEGEMASYRFSVVGLVLGTAGMVLWLWQSGLPMWVAALVVVVALGLLVALTRIVAEAGTPTITSGMVPTGFTVSTVGVSALGAPGVVALGYTFVWFNDLLVFMTAPLANSLRLGSELAGDRRRLLWGLAAAMLISLVLSTWYTLRLAYTHGAVNLHQQYFSTFAAEPSKFAAQKLLHPTGPDSIGWLWTGGGALADEYADRCAQLLGLVATASFGLCREHGLGHGSYLVLDFSRLVRQDLGTPLWGRGALPQDGALLPRHSSRPDRYCGDLARRRWVHWGGGQPPAGVLSLRDNSSLAKLDGSSKRVNTSHKPPSLGWSALASRLDTIQVVVVSQNEMNQFLDTVVVCPLTSALHPQWRSRLQIQCAGKEAEIAVDQIRTISKQRLRDQIDRLSTETAAQLRRLVTEMYGE